MEFQIEKAGKKELEEIMELMEEACQRMENPEWYARDEKENVEKLLTGAGAGVFAREKELGTGAGFFLMAFPGSRDNMGKYLGLTGSDLDKVVYMDSVVVKPKFRGHGLQGRMLKEAEALLDALGERARYRMCTVHPDNRFSLDNMKNNGYQVIGRGSFYGGKERLVLYRDAYEKF